MAPGSARHRMPWITVIGRRARHVRYVVNAGPLAEAPFLASRGSGKAPSHAPRVSIERGPGLLSGAPPGNSPSERGPWIGLAPRRPCPAGRRGATTPRPEPARAIEGVDGSSLSGVPRRDREGSGSDEATHGKRRSARLVRAAGDPGSLAPAGRLGPGGRRCARDPRWPGTEGPHRRPSQRGLPRLGDGRHARPRSGGRWGATGCSSVSVWGSLISGGRPRGCRKTPRGVPGTSRWAIMAMLVRQDPTGASPVFPAVESGRPPASTRSRTGDRPRDGP